MAPSPPLKDKSQPVPGPSLSSFKELEVEQRKQDGTEEHKQNETENRIAQDEPEKAGDLHSTPMKQGTAVSSLLMTSAMYV
jgi:hypothetical protein